MVLPPRCRFQRLCVLLSRVPVPVLVLLQPTSAPGSMLASARWICCCETGTS